MSTDVNLFEKDDTVDITTTSWWKESKHLALVGARLKVNMTQAALATATGIPVKRLSAYECGKKSVDKSDLDKIKKALKAPSLCMD